MRSKSLRRRELQTARLGSRALRNRSGVLRSKRRKMALCALLRAATRGRPYAHNGDTSAPCLPLEGGGICVANDGGSYLASKTSLSPGTLGFPPSREWQNRSYRPSYTALQIIHPLVDAVFLQQLGVGANLCDAPVVQNHDGVRQHQGADAVGD